MNCFAIKKFQLRYTIKKTNKNTLNPPSLTDSRAPPGSGSREKKGGAPPLLCSPLARAPWPRQQPGLAAAAVSAGRLRAAVRWSGPVARAAGEAGQGRSQGRGDGARHLRGDRRRQRRGARGGAAVRFSRGRPAAEAARTRLGAQANPVR